MIIKNWFQQGLTQALQFLSWPCQCQVPVAAHCSSNGTVNDLPLLRPFALAEGHEESCINANRISDTTEVFLGFQ